MNLLELHRKLITAARANPPSGRVPYAFEKRIMARLKSCSGFDVWALWARALWRAAAPCIAIMVLLGAFTYFDRSAPASTGNNLSQDFENTVLAAVYQDNNSMPGE
ncbi:MAG TPA: hypothetical protein VKA67_14135 [Verrucomicrobiae bacterium]|nr:hypothetical protein [Verrucomicrobiae bacterium]